MVFASSQLYTKFSHTKLSIESLFFSDFVCCMALACRYQGFTMSVAVRCACSFEALATVAQFVLAPLACQGLPSFPVSLPNLKICVVTAAIYDPLIYFLAVQSPQVKQFRRWLILWISTPAMTWRRCHLMTCSRSGSKVDGRQFLLRIFSFFVVVWVGDLLDVL